MVVLYEDGGFGTEVFEVALYSTQALRDSHSTTAEVTVAGYLSDALEDLEVNHRIYWRFDPIPLDNQQAVCGDDSVYGEWIDYLNQKAPFVAVDSNLLMTDARGGGCGGVGGNVCSSGASWIEDFHVEKESPEGWAGNVSAALHEIGHNMGFWHEPHPGWGENRDPYWHRTPNNSANDVDNLCGLRIPKRDFEDAVNHLYYNPCTKEHMENNPVPSIHSITTLDADTSMVVGQQATIDIEITNRTPVDEGAEVDVVVASGGSSSVIETIQRDVPALGSITDSVNWTPPDTGEWTITVGGASITRSVDPDGTVSLAALSANPTNADVGEAVNIAATLQNTTSESAMRSFDVIADQGTNRPESVVGTLEFSVPGGSSDTEGLVWRPDEAADYTIRVGDKAVAVTVNEEDGTDPGEGSVEVRSISVEGDPRVDEETTIVVRARNPGSAEANRSLSVIGDPGGVLGRVSFTIPGGEEQFRNLSWTPQDTGEVTLSASTAETVVTVESGSGGEDPPGDGPVIPGVPLPDLRPALPGLATAGLIIARPEE